MEWVMDTLQPWPPKPCSNISYTFTSLKTVTDLLRYWRMLFLGCSGLLVKKKNILLEVGGYGIFVDRHYLVL